MSKSVVYTGCNTRVNAVYCAMLVYRATGYFVFVCTIRVDYMSV